jgi:hypothetical protein
MAAAGITTEATALFTDIGTSTHTKVGTDSVVSMAAAGISTTATLIRFTTGSSHISMATGGVSIGGGLHVLGGLTVGGGISASDVGITASDMRLKTDIVRLTESLKKVSKLRGVYYRWNDDANAYGLGANMDDVYKLQVGVLAQEVQAVLPEVVGQLQPGSKHLGVNYPALVPLLIEAIRELDERDAGDSITTVASLVALQAKFEALQAKFDDQTSKHDALITALLKQNKNTEHALAEEKRRQLALMDILSSLQKDVSDVKTTTGAATSRAGDHQLRSGA